MVSYVSDVGEIVDRIGTARLQGGFLELHNRVRAYSERFLGVNSDTPLVVFGEQPDPPLVKHVGKSVLAQVLTRRVKQRDRQLQAIHLVLCDDVFGSNADVFTALGGLSRGEVDGLSKQTYAYAPITGKYVCSIAAALQKACPEQVRDLLGKSGLDEIGLTDMALGITRARGGLCDFNVAVRNMLEAKILPYREERQPLRGVEQIAFEDEGLFSFLRPYSAITGKNGVVGYVTMDQRNASEIHPMEMCRRSVLWNKRERPLVSSETGCRRYALEGELSDLTVKGPREGEVLFRGSAAELAANPSFRAFSLNAGGRAALLYILTVGGVTVTGGGSTYNEPVIEEWVRAGLPEPVVCYLSHPTFVEEGGKRLLSNLCGRVGVVAEILRNAERIERTDSYIFGSLLPKGALE